MKIIRLPLAFVQDSTDRCNYDLIALKQNHQSIWISSEDPNLRELLADARHQADPEMGFTRKDRVAGARRLIKAYESQQ